jgi:hypothetical protein
LGVQINAQMLHAHRQESFAELLKSKRGWYYLPMLRDATCGLRVVCHESTGDIP